MATILQEPVEIQNIRILPTYTNSMVAKWNREIDGWANIYGQTIAKNSLEAINGGSDILIVVDNHDKLVAIATYMIIGSQLRHKMVPQEHHEKVPKLIEAIKQTATIFLYRLAGNGRGGSRMIVDELKRRSITGNFPILLNSHQHATGFYEKMGFSYVADTHQMYWMKDKV